MTITEAQRKVAVAHADLMGCGIASVFALGEFDVVYDLAPLALSHAKQNCHAVFLELAVARVITPSQVATAEGRVRTVKSIAELSEAALTIEAIAESVDARQSLYFALEGVLSKTAILACGTSGIVPEALSEHLRRPCRFLAAHFWNPPHINPLVEVVPAPRTEHDTLAATMEWLTAANCEPVLPSKAVSGFIGSLRFAVPREALHMLQAGIADADTIDEVMKQSLGRRYRWIGPLEGADIGGRETFLAIGSELPPHLASRDQGLDVLGRPVSEKRGGRRDGQGIYPWNVERDVRLSQSHLQMSTEALDRDAGPTVRRDSYLPKEKNIMRQPQLSIGRLGLQTFRVVRKILEADINRTHLLCSGTVIGSVSLLLAACGGDSGGDSQVGAASAASVCAKLNGATTGGVAGLSAKVIPATSTAPTYCQVTGTIPPQLGIEIRLPDDWNGKLYYQGGAGMDGSIPDLPVAALTKGYAEVGSDGGHKGNAFDASFALNDPLALNMWGHLSIPTALSSAKEVVRDAYGRPPDRSYFDGCSTGGREALMTVQRYPTLFDGVIAGDPSYDFVGLIGWFNRNAKALAAPGGALTSAKLQLLSQSVLQKCDALDGVVDGIVSNPAACSKSGFDPRALRCAGGGDLGNTCLSDAQLNSIASLTTTAQFGTAPNTYTQVGHPFTGNEATQWLAGSAGAKGDGDYTVSAGYLFQDTIIRNIIARNPAVNPLTFTYDQDLNALFSTASIVNATSTDIRPFINNGGKLIMWHGGSDDFYPAQGTANYYDAMVSAVGGKSVAGSAVRLYIPPGVGHCGNGPGAAPADSDLLQSLDDWVTKSISPGTLLATKLTPSGDTAFTRPLCQYPTYPRYSGPAGDAAAAKLARNYTCTAPSP